MIYISLIACLPILIGNVYSKTFEDSFQANCARLASTFKDGKTTIHSSQYVAKGEAFNLGNLDPGCKMMAGASAFTSTPKYTAPADMCRVAAYLATSSRSGINFDLWMPLNWTGRFFSEGNGGLSGCEWDLNTYKIVLITNALKGIAYGAISKPVTFGFAAISANGVSDALQTFV